MKTFIIIAMLLSATAAWAFPGDMVDSPYSEQSRIKLGECGSCVPADSIPVCCVLQEWNKTLDWREWVRDRVAEVEQQKKLDQAAACNKINDDLNHAIENLQETYLGPNVCKSIDAIYPILKKYSDSTCWEPDWESYKSAVREANKNGADSINSKEPTDINSLRIDLNTLSWYKGCK